MVTESAVVQGGAVGMFVAASREEELLWQPSWGESVTRLPEYRAGFPHHSAGEAIVDGERG